MKRSTRNVLIGLAFLLPNFLGFFVFTAGPVLFSMAASFTNWNLQRTVPLQFVGFRNFSELLADPQFWLYFVNTGYFLLGMPVAIFGSLFLATLLNSDIKGSVIFRTLLYLPSFTSGVAIMVLWKVLYNPDFGPINAILRPMLDVIGLSGIDLPSWLLSTQNVLGLEVEKVGVNGVQFGLGARDAIIFMGIWGAIGGGNMLLYLAALSNVPPELIEAAELDGAGRWQSFWRVTWPQLAPTTFFIVVMSTIGGLQGGFEQARVMTQGGPAGTTTTLAYYIYQKAFEQFQIGYASAVAWVLFAVVFTVTVLQWRFGNKETSIL